MRIRERAQTGRRSRRPNGEPRQNTPWSVKGMEDSVRTRISLLATVLDTTNAAIIDLATKQLLSQLTAEDKDELGKGNTLSSSLTDYAFLLSKDNEPSNDPKVIKLEKRLQERRRVRDEYMSKKSSDPRSCSPKVVSGAD